MNKIRPTHLSPIAVCIRSKRTERGQFIPISAMVMFTMVVLMVAMVNVYKVSRAKLKVQNLADAAALNIASQEAQAFNAVADRNEWLNHIVAGVPSPSDLAQQGQQPCAITADPAIVPGISCVENTADPNEGSPRTQLLKRHVFHSKDGATNFANLVETINQAQDLFVQAYNNFIGAGGNTGTSSAISGGGSLKDLLETDIPDLKNDPTIHLVTWNSTAGEAAASAKENELAHANAVSNKSSGADINAQNMAQLHFTRHNVDVRYFQKRCLFKYCIENTAVAGSDLGTLAGDSQGVGYEIPDPNSSNMPTLKIQGNSNSGPKQRVGVGVYVVKNVDLHIPGMKPVNVEAQSKAYVVDESGKTGDPTKPGETVNGVAIFKPTYWVKLAND